MYDFFSSLLYFYVRGNYVKMFLQLNIKMLIIIKMKTLEIQLSLSES